MTNNLLIYQATVRDAYLFFIKENFTLINQLITERSQMLRDPQYKNHNPQFVYSMRAKHLQTMSLIGMNAEHILKLVLLKRGFVLNTETYGNQFDDTFQKSVESYNYSLANSLHHQPNQFNSLYNDAPDHIVFQFTEKLQSFEKCITLFMTEIVGSTNYFQGVGEYRLSSKYFSETKLNAHNSLCVIQKMRNSYLHLAEAKREPKNIVSYLFNFLLWICKKEYPSEFEGHLYIGNEVVLKKFS